MVNQLVTVPTNPDTMLCVFTRSPAPRMEDQLVEVPPIVPQLVPFFAGADGYVWRQLSGPTGAYWWRVGSSHTQWAPPTGGTPPGQGGTQILAAATVADVVVADVPVNMQHKFPQFWCFIQFICRVVVIPVATQRQVWTALLCRRTLRFHSCSSWTSVSFPFVQRQVLVQAVQKTVDLPQVQLLWCCGRHCEHTARSSSPVIRFSRDSVDRVPDIPVMPTVQFLNKVVDMVLRQLPTVQTVQSSFVHQQGRRHPYFRTVEVLQIQSSTELNDDLEAGLAHFLDSPVRG